ncbi:MAG TPA: GNAT family N-acetyltransferase [Spirochaetia bacterium]|nr:GNAT family N-acetyltransferase [Spirochaetia bacterium]
MACLIVPMAQGHVPQAAELFRGAYQRERRCSPLLPPEPLGGEGTLREHLLVDLANPGVVAVDGGRLIGYLCVSARFPFKGLSAALVREHSHSAAPGQEPSLLPELYAALGETLIEQGVQLHIVAHLASDGELKETLFQLGFGAFLTERLRDLSPVEGAALAPIEPLRDPGELVALEMEHRRYYLQSPIFLTKDDTREAALAGLCEDRDSGRTALVYRDHGTPAAYMVVGPCSAEQEGRLLRGSKTAQVCSAYATPSVRGRGIGRALLQGCVDWARCAGYERLFVEHETANLAGRRFWGRHFAPYLHFSMRYVEGR